MVIWWLLAHTVLMSSFKLGPRIHRRRLWEDPSKTQWVTNPNHPICLQRKAEQGSCLPAAEAIGVKAGWLYLGRAGRVGKGTRLPGSFLLSGRILCAVQGGLRGSLLDILNQGTSTTFLCLWWTLNSKMLREGTGKQSIIEFWFGNQPRPNLIFKALWMKNKLSVAKPMTDTLTVCISHTVS